jgi:hypothetical protein
LEIATSGKTASKFAGEYRSDQRPEKIICSSSNNSIERKPMSINLIPSYCVEKPYLDPRRSAPVALSQAVGLMIALEEQERRADAFVSACNIMDHLNTKQIKRSFANALQFADAFEIDSLKGKNLQNEAV